MGYRCAHHYESGDQCIYAGCKNEGDLCPAHLHLDSEARQKQQKRELNRKIYAEQGIPWRGKYAATGGRPKKPPKPAPTPPPPPALGPPRDPTAPWCTCENTRPDINCCSKPDFTEWRNQVNRR